MNKEEIQIKLLEELHKQNIFNLYNKLKTVYHNEGIKDNTKVLIGMIINTIKTNDYLESVIDLIESGEWNEK